MTTIYTTALSGLTAQREKAMAHASNIANAHTVGTTDGSKPAYTPVDSVSFSAGSIDGLGGGVRTETTLRNPAHTNIYDPNSPFANEEGVISAPNVSLEHEIIGLKMAETMYKANATVIKTKTEMDKELLNILT